MPNKSATEMYDKKKDEENFRTIQKKLGREKRWGPFSFGEYNFTEDQWVNLSPEAKRYLIDTLVQTLTAGPAASLQGANKIEGT